MTARTSRLVRILIGAFYSVVLIGPCASPQTHRLRQAPHLATLGLITKINAPDSAAISGVAGLSSCDVVMADYDGRLSLLRPQNSGGAKILDTIPGRRALTLELIDGVKIGLWSDIPPLAGLLALDPFSIDSIPIRWHPWGGVWSGPVARLRDNRLAFAPLGNPGKARRMPEAAVATRLVEIRNQDGVVERSVGPEVPKGVGYLPWLSSRIVLGSHGDTLLIAHLEDGIVERYDVGASKTSAEAEYDLPRYFETQKPRVEVLSMPWIQYGEREYVYDTPQLRAATFDEQGRLYAIQSFGYKWAKHKSPYLRRNGEWQWIERGLEIYGTTGEILGSYELPADVYAIRADAVGRLFLLYVTGEVGIVQNPVAGPTVCHAPPA